MAAGNERTDVFVSTDSFWPPRGQREKEEQAQVVLCMDEFFSHFFPFFFHFFFSFFSIFLGQGISKRSWSCEKWLAELMGGKGRVDRPPR